MVCRVAYVGREWCGVVCGCGAEGVSVCVRGWVERGVCVCCVCVC